MSDLTLQMLANVQRGCVRYQWIMRNSGPDHKQWFIGGNLASFVEAGELGKLYNQQLLVDSAPEGTVELGAKGEARLALGRVSGDPLRQTAGRQVLVDGDYVIDWDGLWFHVMHPGRSRHVWQHRVCAVDDNVEQVARDWWASPIGKAKVEAFIEHADW